MAGTSSPFPLSLSSVLVSPCRHLQCGGHIQSFAIVSEEAIAKGIRRIVALTGGEAEKVTRKGRRREGMEGGGRRGEGMKGGGLALCAVDSL